TYVEFASRVQLEVFSDCRIVNRIMSSRGVTSTENDGIFFCLLRPPNFLIDPEDEGKH
ncbi:hypothetical protein K0M31_001690, partial [Melipona bicolor]